MKHLPLFLFCIGISLAGCECNGAVTGGDGGLGDGDVGAPPIDGLVSIDVEPASVTLRVVGTTPATQEYTATGHFEDGDERDITARVAFRLEDPSLGGFDGATFTSGIAEGGRTRVQARAGDVVGEAELVVVLEEHVEIPPSGGAPALPTDPRGLFEGPADDGRAPELVYPNGGVVLPPNLGRMEVHWLKGADANTLFDVAFTNDVTDVHAYVRCERPAGVRDDGCVWEVNGEVWRYVAETNRGSLPVQVTVRATDDDGTGVGTSGSRDASFALDDLEGTIYYWTVSEGGRIMRYDFGAASGLAERVMGPELTESGRCVGCHALSNDGTKIVGSVGGQNNGGMLLFDLEAGMPLRNATADDDHIIQFADFDPDGNELVGVYGDDTSREDFGDLLLFDTRCDAGTMGTCGMQTGTIDLGGAEASHPDWSPDGDRIVYTDVGHHETSQRPGHGAIHYVERDGDSWTGPHELVPRADGKNRFTPFFAPDGSFVVYGESVCPGGDVTSRACNADTDPSTTVWAVPRDGGTSIELEAAMAPGTMDDGETELASTFPRFAPFVFTLSSGDLGPVQVVWLTFSSTRVYGLRTPMDSSGAEAERSTWLWMTAVRPDQLAMGADPSAPAFALPFQDLETSNHIAVWTTESVGDPDLF